MQNADCGGVVVVGVRGICLETSELISEEHKW